MRESSKIQSARGGQWFKEKRKSSRSAGFRPAQCVRQGFSLARYKTSKPEGLSGVHQLVEFDLEADALSEARASSCTPNEGEKDSRTKRFEGKN